MITGYHRDRTCSLANGIHLSGIFLGSGLGGLGGWLAERHDWAYAFRLFFVRPRPAPKPDKAAV